MKYYRADRDHSRRRDRGTSEQSATASKDLAAGAEDAEIERTVFRQGARVHHRGLMYSWLIGIAVGATILLFWRFVMCMDVSTPREKRPESPTYGRVRLVNTRKGKR